jgi:hypothetical protein
VGDAARAPRRGLRLSRRGRAVALATAALVLGGCAVRQLARTVGRGRTEVGVLVGGPLQSNLGFAAPVPEHRIRARGGLTDDLDLDGSLALAPLASAILALDIGFVAQIVRRPRFAAAGSVRLHGVYDLDQGMGGTYYPELGLHLEQRIDPRVAIFEGLAVLVSPSPAPGAPAVFVAPSLGLEVLLGEHALSLGLAWINPWDDSRAIVRWEPAGLGAIVVTFGWRIQPGGVR